MSQFSLSWDAQKNICSGLSSLQQNGEFVDMTLAADGHLVKVHQIVIALASPYIKELISSANCPHPVIFLNKVSYKTLCSLLEYVYTGEVLVSIENLNDLIEAGKELHIKGIEDMTVQQSVSPYTRNDPKAEQDDSYCYFEIGNPSDDVDEDTQQENIYQTQLYSDNDKTLKDQDFTNSTKDNVTEILDENEISLEVSKDAPDRMMQYTVSNQGSLQLILNRFIYYVKHTNRNNVRQWRCVDYVNKGRCPAYVITKKDIVIKRIGVHKHPFHDNKILKKVKAGTIFTAINEAEKEGSLKKVKSSSPITYSCSNDESQVDSDKTEVNT